MGVSTVKEVTKEDLELIAMATATIKRNYDKEKLRHTVAAAVRCSSGRIYTGVNVYSIHGACAEMIAIGSAITAGEREFDCLAAVRGENGEELLSPCGNCRQFLADYIPHCKIIINTNQGLKKINAAELLPFDYAVPD